MLKNECLQNHIEKPYDRTKLFAPVNPLVSVMVTVTLSVSFRVSGSRLPFQVNLRFAKTRRAVGFEIHDSRSSTRVAYGPRPVPGLGARDTLRDQFNINYILRNNLYTNNMQNPTKTARLAKPEFPLANSVLLKHLLIMY